MSLSMSISDEIEDATIAIDETKISETEATKRRIRNYCVQTKKLKYENSKSFDPQSKKRRFRWKIDDLMKKVRRNRRSYAPIERLKYVNL